MISKIEKKNKRFCVFLCKFKIFLQRKYNYMENKKWVRCVLLALAAFFAGIINSLVGAGGGIILVFALQWYYGKEGIRNSFALTNAAIFIFSLISVYSYVRKDIFDLRDSFPYVLPALIGGGLGALLLGKVKTKHLKIIFATIMLYSGVRMFI